MNLRMTSFFGQADHLKKFAEIAKSKGLNTSALLRLLIADCIRKDARETRVAAR